MINKFNKTVLVYIFFSLYFINFSFVGINLVSATEWYKGDLHQHTGFSTFGGYENISDSSCPLLLEDILPKYGYTVQELRDQAVSLDLDYLGFSDHSYCLNKLKGGYRR